MGHPNVGLRNVSVAKGKASPSSHGASPSSSSPGGGFFASPSPKRRQTELGFLPVGPNFAPAEADGGYPSDPFDYAAEQSPSAKVVTRTSPGKLSRANSVAELKLKVYSSPPQPMALPLPQQKKRQFTRAGPNAYSSACPNSPVSEELPQPQQPPQPRAAAFSPVVSSSVMPSLGGSKGLSFSSPRSSLTRSGAQDPHRATMASTPWTASTAPLFASSPAALQAQKRGYTNIGNTC
eukprot:RCo010394